jgi:hypothetical protein
VDSTHHQRKSDTVHATGSLAILDSGIFDFFECAPVVFRLSVNFVLDLREQLFQIFELESVNDQER